MNGVDSMSTTSATEKWGKLTRRDITFLDALGIEMVLTAQALGADTRVTQNNHVILRSPDGSDTLAISRNLASYNRGAQNARAQFKRVFGMTLEQAQARLKAEVRQERRRQSKNAAPAPQPVAEPELFHCPAKDCASKFTEYVTLERHVDDQHYRCTAEGCHYVARTAQGLTPHRRIVHEGWKPRKGTGKTNKADTSVEEVPVATQQVEKEAMETTAPEQAEESLDHLEELMKREDYLVIKRPQTLEDFQEALRRMLPPTGPSLREQELEDELAKVMTELEDLQAKVALLKETLGL